MLDKVAVEDQAGLKPRFDTYPAGAIWNNPNKMNITANSVASNN